MNGRIGLSIFRTQITSQERSFFIGLTDALAVPETACAVFIPPSVVQQAMWPAMRGEAAGDSAEVSGIAPDAGAVVAVRSGSLKTMVNALFAYPPLAPGIDVYQGEQLLAGYTYNDHPECLEGLNEVMKTYLK